MRIPLTEEYYGYAVNAVPVYLGAFQHAEQQTNEHTESPPPSTNTDDDAQLKKFVNLLKSRAKRDTAIYKTSTLHTPDFIATKETLKEVDPTKSKILSFKHEDCEKKSNMMLCDITGSNLHSMCVRTLIKIIQNPKTQVADFCLREDSATYDSCTVTRTQDASTLILSTATPIPIVALATGPKSIFEKNVGGEECNNVCLIREDRTFRCQSTTYTTRANENIKIRHKDETIETKIDLSTMRKKDSSEINPFRFNILDRHPIAARIKNTMEVVYFLLVTVIISCLVVRLVLRQVIRRRHRLCKTKATYPSLD